MADVPPSKKGTKGAAATARKPSANKPSANGAAGEAEFLEDLLAALTAARDGDFAVRLRVRRSGVERDIANAFNELVGLHAARTKELQRIAQVVGKDGRLGERLNTGRATGEWAQNLETINGLIDDLVRPTTEVARVMTAVAGGDLTQKMALDIDGQPVRGEFLRMGRTVNTMVDQLSSFAEEVTRVAREVGTEGQLGGQARVKGVSGTWKDLTDSVNSMASNLTAQVRDIAQVTTAVARGDLTQKIQVDVRGEILELKNTINTMVDQLSSFADEVTRVAREVGTEGKLGGQAQVRGVSGVWEELTDNVNFMAANLTTQVRNIAEVATAVASGDLSRKIEVEAQGEVAVLAQTINTMVDQLSAFAAEVTRVAREVGTEGRLGGQARVEGVSGTWRDLTDSVNSMAANLTSQVRNIAEVTTAVAKGDLTRKITVDVRGEILELKDTINTMVDQLSSFADEVTRVAREVGTEGELGGQAQVEGVSGTWRDLTDSVNSMASNLTSQVRNIAEVTTAVARGDLTRKITVDVRGEILALKNTINTMVDQLSSFADEVTRVAREVGTEGKLGGQAQVTGVSGTWKDLTDNVNFMAGNLTTQVRNIAQVATAVAKGDLSQKIRVEAQGEIAVLADTINVMVDQLSSFADEVTRVAREVGTEGRLGGQAQVEGVSGVWKGLTDNVNSMASNLTAQVRDIAQVTTAVARGDLSQKITVDVRGEILELKQTINTMVDQLSAFADEVTRVAREVGTEGQLGGQARVKGVSGTWKDLTDNVNFMAANLTTQVRSIAEVTTAVAQGDLSRKIDVEAQGEVAVLADTINTMVDQLSSFADEVTRVAREVGTEGRLGGQARVEGVSGTWRDLTDSVNFLAANLTSQVRNIAEVTTAVAKGDLTRKITVDVRGEILELKNTINTMVDQLSAFAAEVTRVAREVGTEGKLGGQAQVGGVAGTWRGLTENVNQLAATLTSQLRAIADVSTAVTQGDLSRSIDVEAAGEVADLKDNINQMIANLRETTRVNAEQDWLKTNLARISGLMQGQRNLETVSRLLMSELTPLVAAQHGAFFLASDDAKDGRILQLIATYGYKARKSISNRFKVGEALVGQAALENNAILITQAPDDYIKISSGLGETAPVNIIVLPVMFEDVVLGVIELASLHEFTEVHRSFLEQLVDTIGVVLNTIMANMRTEELLLQSQRLTEELQAQQEELQAQQEELRRSNAELESQAQTLKASEELLQTQQEELQQTNAELEEKAALLAEQNRAIEIKNREIELARRSLEEKAEQLAVSSRYKSEFLANMSHELRTPLNSLLILAKLLADNPQGNLDEKQVDFARTIFNAGNDLLSLINDILDLSKVEAGKMDINPAIVEFTTLRTELEDAFQPVAADRNLDFEIALADTLPVSIMTDQQRLQQILRNLLSNAFKFTEQGSVTLRMGWAPEGVAYLNDSLARQREILAFSVADTGIGIPQDKLRVIFESFQQADGTTSRKYGGTGLGLSISREIARLLGGEIHVESAVGEGSVFTLYLPTAFTPPETRSDDDEDGDTAPPPSYAPFVGTGSPDPAAALAVPSADAPADDRDAVEEGDRTLLAIVGDEHAAELVREAAHVHGFKVLIAVGGQQGVAMAHQERPTAIALDILDPPTEALAILDNLKHQPDTRHIPVLVVGDEDQRHQALRSGAVAHLGGPASPETLEEAIGDVARFVERPVRHLLVVEDDERQRDAVVELIGGGDDVIITAVGSSEEALDALGEHPFDCVVLDLKLPKTTGFSLLETIKTDPNFSDVPIIIYTGKQLTSREETRLRKYAETIIVKDANSPERLLAETALYLHRQPGAMQPEKRRMIDRLHGTDVVLQGKKVLIVDDDVRNVFALTSALESAGMTVVYAENGREGLATLDANQDTDLVLMDVMMPEMDGYETTRAIRQQPQYRDLPIISLTAKAMKGDREKSVGSGASDYITKPVDIEQLLSLMRVWLYR